MTPKQIERERDRIALAFATGLNRILSRKLMRLGAFDGELADAIAALSREIEATIPPGMPRHEVEVVTARLPEPLRSRLQPPPEEPA